MNENAAHDSAQTGVQPRRGTSEGNGGTGKQYFTTGLPEAAVFSEPEERGRRLGVLHFNEICPVEGKTDSLKDPVTLGFSGKIYFIKVKFQGQIGYVASWAGLITHAPDQRFQQIDLPFKRHTSPCPAATGMPEQELLCLDSRDSAVPYYSDTPGLFEQPKPEPAGKLQGEVIFFKPVKAQHFSYYPEPPLRNGEAGPGWEVAKDGMGYACFELAGKGKVWVAFRVLQEIAGVQKLGEDKRIVLTTTVPIMEGDRTDYRLHIFEDEHKQFTFSTLGFMDVGAYAVAEIADVLQDSSGRQWVRFLASAHVSGKGLPPIWYTFAEIRRGEVVRIFRLEFNDRSSSTPQPRSSDF